MLKLDSPRLTLPLRARLAGEICDGLTHLHRGGVVHRDIKVSFLCVGGERGLRAPMRGPGRRMEGLGVVCVCVRGGAQVVPPTPHPTPVSELQTDNIMISFTQFGPSAKIGDLGCGGRLQRCGFAPARGTRGEGPEVHAAIAACKGPQRPLCVSPAHDVWQFGERVLPRLLPREWCMAQDWSWGACALPLLDSCAAASPQERPSTQCLSSFFHHIAGGAPAATAALPGRLPPPPL